MASLDSISQNFYATNGGEKADGTNPLFQDSYAGSQTALNRILAGSESSGNQSTVYTDSDTPPRPPEALSTGEQLSAIANPVAAAIAGTMALKKLQATTGESLSSAIANMDSVKKTPEYRDFVQAGNDLSARVSPAADKANRALNALQTSNPELFEGRRFVPDGPELKVPRLDVMTDAQKAVVNKAEVLGDIQQRLQGGTNPTSRAQLDKRIFELSGLGNRSAELGGDIAAGGRRVEKLSQDVLHAARRDTILRSADRSALFRSSLGALAAGVGTNFLIEKLVLTDSAPGIMTTAADIASPFVVATPLRAWAKAGVIVGAHMVGRFVDGDSDD